MTSKNVISDIVSSYSYIQNTNSLKIKTAYVQAGQGVVYDSIAQNEYQETINRLNLWLELFKTQATF